MQHAAPLGLEPRLHPIELARRSGAGLGGPGEQGLLVQDVGALERVVAGELERLVPAPPTSKEGQPICAPGHSERSSISQA